MFDFIQTFLGEIAVVLMVLTVITGIAQCFFGYRLLKFWITLIGGVIGFVLGVLISEQFLKDSTAVVVIIGIAAAILMGFLAFKIYLLGVFVFCGLLGLLLVSAIPFPEGDGWTILAFVLELAAFILVGILSVKFSRPFIIILTSFSGAFSAIRALSSVAVSIEFLQTQEGRIIISLILAGCGLMLQFLMTAGEAPVRKRRR